LTRADQYVHFQLIAKLNSKGAAAMSDDHLMTLVGDNVQSTAEWRRRKAEEFPEDARNLKAAENLEQLAAEIEQLEGSEIHQQIRDVQERLNKVGCDGDGHIDVWSHIIEVESEELRSVGFHVSYDTGLQFLEWHRDLLEEKFQEALDEAVPVPDLDEQIANDPGVKAAKQVYDEARAKARAEARKRL
jgi:hypothetical protein